eukprot:TRINITY_DN1735_c0_g1_i4.p1 TRINITY_DN1735_c0_g1~~TRINITY_DN1735_c0_g1_i4.p1  ORF type:complete len:615 (+),score=85.21 TRINITY_DN1735_c0_g1_i4:155-1999(+)
MDEIVGLSDDEYAGEQFGTVDCESFTNFRVEEEEEEEDDNGKRFGNAKTFVEYLSNREKKQGTRLSYLKVKGFFSFKEETELSLSDGLLLIGPNGGGKSNFSRVVELIISGFNDAKDAIFIDLDGALATECWIEAEAEIGQDFLDYFVGKDKKAISDTQCVSYGDSPKKAKIRFELPGERLAYLDEIQILSQDHDLISEIFKIFSRSVIVLRQDRGLISSSLHQSGIFGLPSLLRDLRKLHLEDHEKFKSIQEVFFSLTNIQLGYQYDYDHFMEDLAKNKRIAQDFDDFSTREHQKFDIQTMKKVWKLLGGIKDFNPLAKYYPSSFYILPKDAKKILNTFTKLVGFKIDERDRLTYDSETNLQPIKELYPHFEEGSRRLNFEQISGGDQEILMIIILLHLSNTTVILDEPGGSVHPDKRHLLLHSIENLNRRSIIITHAQEMLVSSSWKKTIYFNSRGGETRIYLLGKEKVNVEPSLRPLFFARKVCFVEGKTEVALFEAFLELLRNAKEQLKRPSGIEKEDLDKLSAFTFIPLNGCGAGRKTVRLAKKLGIECTFLMDRDKEEKERRKFFEEMGITENDTKGLIFLWKKDVEHMISETKKGFCILLAFSRREI